MMKRGMQTMSDDLIRRSDAIKALRLEYPRMPMFKDLREEWAIKTEGFRKAEEVIVNLPSADRPQVDAELKADFLKRQYEAVLEENKRLKADRPKGEWIYCEDEYGIDGYRCSNCGKHIPWDYQHKFINFIDDYHTCPFCDARMKGADDE